MTLVRPSQAGVDSMYPYSAAGRNGMARNQLPKVQATRSRSSKARSPAIPYEKIDPEIRNLVSLLNRIPGLHTLWSCAGHTVDEACYVTIQTDLPNSLESLVRAMPFWGFRAGFRENRGWSQFVYATLNENLTYNLQIEGYPLQAKRDLIHDIERALEGSLSENLL
jgi:hypothetical protein